MIPAYCRQNLRRLLPLGKVVVLTQYLDDEIASACVEIADAVDYFDACIRDTQQCLP